MKTKHIMLIAGEASGEQHGASLVRSLQKRADNWQFSGIGGKQMAAAGVDLFVDCADLSVMGFTDVIMHLPAIIRIFNATVAQIKQTKPDLLVLIDYPGFNLRLAKVAKKLGIKVLFYISPQIWAWRRGRVKKIARCVDHMAVIFPFEKAFYEQTALPVTYVGHPLTQTVHSDLTQAQAEAHFGLAEDADVVGIFPGSRRREIERLLPVLLKAAEKIQQERPQCQFILPVASTLKRELFTDYLSNCRLPVNLVEANPYDVMQACDAIMLASGTATLEAALMRKPMAIVYKVPYLTGLLLRWLIKIPYVGLVNIVAEKALVPELLQAHANAKELSGVMLRILRDEGYREAMLSGLSGVADKLGTEDGSENLARLVADLVD